MQAGSPGPDALLLGAGLSIDSQNEEGETALYLAAYR